MLYPLSYEGGPGQVSRTTRANRLGLAHPSTGQNGPMADPLLQLEERLAAAFAAVAGRPVDPVVRASDRADAQANGALALAKELGRPPRELAQAVIDAADLDGICRDVELAGPGFINLTFDDGYLARDRRRGGHRPATGAPPGRRPRARRHRLLASERRQGDARRAPAHDHDRRRAGPHARPTPATPSSGRTTSATGARRSACSSSTWSTSGRPRPRASCPSATSTASTSRPGTKFDADEAFRERARRRVVALQGGDPATLRLWTRLVEESTRYFDAVYGRLGVLLRGLGPDGRERLQRPPARGRPAPGRGRACWSSPTARRSSSRPASRTATASRCR